MTLAHVFFSFYAMVNSRASSNLQRVCAAMSVIFDPLKRVYEIQNPLLMTHTREMSSQGLREGLSLSRWFQPFTEQKYFSISATSVVTSAEASPGLAKYYEYVLKRIGDEIDGIITEEKELDDYTNDEIYDELLEEEESPSKLIH